MFFVHIAGYVHLDIKPSNFMVDNNGQIKLGDFGLTKKSGEEDDDFEGDSIYLAMEVLESNSLKQISFKSDVFSIGLSLIEIIFKVELPQSGNLWNYLRSGHFEFDSEHFKHSNFQVPNSMILLVKSMISKIENRPSCFEIFERFDELKSRLLLLGDGVYKRSLDPTQIKILELDNQNIIRSGSENSEINNTLNQYSSNYNTGVYF